MDTATGSVVFPSVIALIWAARPALYIAVAQLTRRDPITQLRCTTDRHRVEVRLTYQPRATAHSNTTVVRPLESASPGATPRLTVLPSERLAARSPHKP